MLGWVIEELCLEGLFGMRFRGKDSLVFMDCLFACA